MVNDLYSLLGALSNNNGQAVRSFKFYKQHETLRNFTKKWKEFCTYSTEGPFLAE